MCGIAGVLVPAGRARADLEAIATGMATALHHRGPDDEGFWIDSAGTVALAHRRLSIVDLSPTGHQPMTSGSGRYVLVYNGEIYNFRALRNELAAAGERFRGTSDTEVLLALVDRWGVKGALTRAVGMFALAIWDKQDRVLTLARDRMGEKPLLVARLPWGLAFASELRAFEVLPGWTYDVDDEALASLLRFGYVTEPRSIDRKVVKLLPAHVVSIRLADVAASGASFDPGPGDRYWDLEDEIAAISVPDTPDAAVDHMEVLLAQSLEGQRVADVPLGSFLSGGIDSSTVTAVLQGLSSTPVRTFSIGFEDSQYDESEFARAVAAHLGCAHTEHRVSGSEALGVVHDLPRIYDEPFADPSQVPTALVARLARRSVTVCLSGDGGDELFGGYNRYFWGGKWGRSLKALPRPVRATLGEAAVRTARVLPESIIQQLVSRGAGGGGAPLQNARGKLEKAIAMLHLDDPVERYSRLTACALDPGAFVASRVSDQRPDEAIRPHMARWGEVFGAMLWDIEGYLPGDQLTRVDRASMAVSLEMRAPLLDHRVAAFAVAATKAFGEARLAARPKWLLQEVLHRRVPKQLVERPKMGFSIPLARWLRVELRDWAETLLAVDALRTNGLNAGAVRELWAAHLQATSDHSRELWSLLMFQQWRAAVRTRPMGMPSRSLV